jgi:hypothetical protein
MPYNVRLISNRRASKGHISERMFLERKTFDMASRGTVFASMTGVRYWNRRTVLPIAAAVCLTLEPTQGKHRFLSRKDEVCA